MDVATPKKMKTSTKVILILIALGLVAAACLLSYSKGKKAGIKSANDALTDPMFNPEGKTMTDVEKKTREQVSKVEEIPAN